MPTHLARPSVPGLNAISLPIMALPGVQDISLTLDEEGKDPAEQLKVLNRELVLENRIKEGAENLLNMQLAPPLRHKVESELNEARNKIEALTKKIDIHTSRTKLNGNSVVKQVKVEETNGDDFPTALQTANDHIKTLVNLSQGLSPAPTTSPNEAPRRSSDNTDSDRQKIQLMSKVTDILRRYLRVRYELNPSEVMQATIPFLADQCSKQCRAAAYRLIRHSLADADSVRRLDPGLDWFIVKTLHRDPKHAVEKEQAIKLIRTIIDVGTIRKDSPTTGDTGTVPLSEPVVRALVAVAEHIDDPFMAICTQTLIEILLIDIDLVSRTGALRHLLHVLADGPMVLTTLVASALLHIVDSPRTRAYLHVGIDLELALSAVTDAYGKPTDYADRMRACTKLIQLMLRTWSGLMYFCMDGMRAIRSLINTLRIPSLQTRDIVLDMFFSLLDIKSTGWSQPFLDGRRLTIYRRNRVAERQSEPQSPEPTQATLKLTDQYYALLLLIFHNAGLYDALTMIFQETTTGSSLSRKATLLLSEMLQLANRVLPLEVAARLQTVPELFSMAADFSNGVNRIVGTAAMSGIDSLNRNRMRLDAPAIAKNSRPRANSAEDVLRRGQRQVEQARYKLNMQMEDKTYQTMISETQLMVTKDYTKWNVELLQELVDGPLLHHRRMEEALKVNRFIRRLMGFFYPFSHRFSDLPRYKSNTKWVKLGCSLLTTLLSTTDGVRYLSTEDQFLMQITRCFAQLDPFNGTSDSTDPIFSKKRVAETLTYGYLEMLGTLSKTKEGIDLLEKFKVFTAFYHLSELKSREDLIKGIIEHLDYNFDGHPRIVLSKALTSSYKHIRLYATRHLGVLLRSYGTANMWTLRLLLTQLYDPAPEVCELAVRFLGQACESKEILQLVVEMQPTIDHLGDIIHPLLLKFMSTQIGFRYLYDAGYIDQEIDMWFHERNLYYVVQVEVFLAKAFHSLSDENDGDVFDGSVPPHFYGEMSKTELGCQILQEKGHFSEFAQFIRKHSQESEDADIILKLKSILWAVGNIGSTEGGLPFLEEEEIIPAILETAETSLIPSVRGTCFFVLGLISSTPQGAELLNDYEWEATLSPVGMPTGICIPTDIERFVMIPTWKPKSVERALGRLLPPTDDHEVEVITAIQNLANAVIANAASRSLSKMKSRPEYRAIFSSPEMFYRALHIISTQRFRLPIRRYILDLFSVDLNRETLSALADAAKRLKAGATYRPSIEMARLSMFGRLGRTRGSGSDEDDELESPIPPLPTEQQPVINLRPVSRIIGFAI
ncbi:hypothetical protein AX16_008062 [Volvariella volvacea WC 439]|nr:hypothetical protein AX16_008062 [Volvariella volvacea WC 439]